MNFHLEITKDKEMTTFLYVLSDLPTYNLEYIRMHTSDTHVMRKYYLQAPIEERLFQTGIGRSGDGESSSGHDFVQNILCTMIHVTPELFHEWCLL